VPLAPYARGWYTLSEDRIACHNSNLSAPQPSQHTFVTYPRTRTLANGALSSHHLRHSSLTPATPTSIGRHRPPVTTFLPPPPDVAMGFGDFSSICERTPIPLCPLVGPASPITGSHFTQSQCYSRSIELANTIIFQGAAGFAHIITLIMLVIMIIHVRSKFTAVGTYNGMEWVREIDRPRACRKGTLRIVYLRCWNPD
jgi:hypothetical protein